MNETTLERLTEDLHGTGGPPLPPDLLAGVKRRGTRRRRARAALVGLAAVTVVGGSVALVAPALTGGSAEVRGVASRPDRLSPLQERVLSDVPGARQVSGWQVVIPEPDGAVEAFAGDSGDVEVVGEVFATGVPSEAGVTAYARSAFPAWLYDGVLSIEESAADENGQPVGSTDMGIAVSNGELALACVSFQGAGCQPTVVRLQDGETHLEWGFGSDRFLSPGSAMEVFAGDAAPEDAPSLAVAGLPDDAVTRVEFVNTAGDVVAGEVDHTMAPGSSILWAEVPGALARVVAYDADGDVVDDHRLRPCSGGVGCEVR